MRQLRWGVGPGHQHWKLPLTPDTLFPPLPQVAWPVLGRRQLLPKEAVCLQAHNTLCTPPLPRISQLAASRGQSGGPGRGSGCLCHSAFQRGPCWAEPPRLASWGYKAGSGDRWLLPCLLVRWPVGTWPLTRPDGCQPLKLATAATARTLTSKAHSCLTAPSTCELGVGLPDKCNTPR